MTESVPGNFIWFDYVANDAEAAIAFYGHVVGWKPQPIQQGYTMFVGSQGPQAGTIALPAEARHGAPPHWSSNVHVADVDATVALVRELGGRVLSEPKDFPNGGRLSTIADPQGATINLFKPANRMTLLDRTKPGAFTWSELYAAEHETAFAFYASLFGWKKSRDFDMGPAGKYLVYSLNGTDLGGMMTKPREMPAPPHWMYYIEIAGLDDAIARAKGKGARVLNGPEDVPGGARIAQLMDPQGGAFALHEAKRSA
ncbi:MAG TPA: VOC family protein [Polyangiaceae bacterium]